MFIVTFWHSDCALARASAKFLLPLPTVGGDKAEVAGAANSLSTSVLDIVIGAGVSGGGACFDLVVIQLYGALAPLLHQSP